MIGMKFRSVLLVFFAMMSVVSFAQEGKRNQKAEVKTTFYCDHCKECETCGQNFQENLLKVKGVRMFEIDQEANTITVYFDSKKTNIGTIRTAISNLGFDADDVKANPDAYEKLDDCCKKA